MTAFYLDVHVPVAIAAELRRRGLDVLTAQEDGTTELEDGDLLVRANSLGRLLFTQDIRFKSLAEDWQRIARPFAGLVFGHQLHGSIGQYPRSRTHRQSHKLGGLARASGALAPAMKCVGFGRFSSQLGGPPPCRCGKVP